MPGSAHARAKRPRVCVSPLPRLDCARGRKGFRFRDNQTIRFIFGVPRELIPVPGAAPILLTSASRGGASGSVLKWRRMPLPVGAEPEHRRSSGVPRRSLSRLRSNRPAAIAGLRAPRATDCSPRSTAVRNESGKTGRLAAQARATLPIGWRASRSPSMIDGPSGADQHPGRGAFRCPHGIRRYFSGAFGCPHGIRRVDTSAWKHGGDEGAFGVRLQLKALFGVWLQPDTAAPTVTVFASSAPSTCHLGQQAQSSR